MAFWSTEKIKTRQAETALVDPYEENSVQQGAYELKMGHQAAISCDGANRITNLKPREAFCIPRGQFALLMSEEKVAIPNDAMGFISLKTKVKSRGLVNVSGFHVDPGYKCRLKFWVYNAGNEDIHVLRGDPIFLIWLSSLDTPTEDIYKNNVEQHNEITGEDLRKLHGTLASPAELAKQIEQLEGKVRMLEWLGGTVLIVLISLCIALATPLLDYVIKPVIERFTKPVTNAPTLSVPATASQSPPGISSSAAVSSAQPQAAVPPVSSATGTPSAQPPASLSGGNQP